MSDPLDTPVDVLEVTVRVQRCLEDNACKTLRDVVAKSEWQLLLTPNFGRVSLRQLTQILDSYGLQLAPSPHPDAQPAPAPPAAPPPTLHPRLQAMTVHQRLQDIEERLSAIELRWIEEMVDAELERMDHEPR